MGSASGQARIAKETGLKRCKRAPAAAERLPETFKWVAKESQVADHLIKSNWKVYSVIF